MAKYTCKLVISFVVLFFNIYALPSMAGIDFQCDKNDQYIKDMRAVLKSIDIEEFVESDKLLGSMSKYLGDSSGCTIELGKAFHAMGYVANLEHDYTRAIEMFNKSISLKLKSYQYEHLGIFYIADSMVQISNSYQFSGDLVKSEKNQKTSYFCCRRRFGNIRNEE